MVSGRTPSLASTDRLRISAHVRHIILTGDHVRIRPHDRARARAERMERVATLRIAPEPANEEAAAERAVDDAEDNGRTSRSGRAIRRPTQLSL